MTPPRTRKTPPLPKNPPCRGGVRVDPPFIAPLSTMARGVILKREAIASMPHQLRSDAALLSRLPLQDEIRFKAHQVQEDTPVQRQLPNEQTTGQRIHLSLLLLVTMLLVFESAWEFWGHRGSRLPTETLFLCFGPKKWSVWAPRVIFIDFYRKIVKKSIFYRKIGFKSDFYWFLSKNWLRNRFLLILLVQKWFLSKNWLQKWFLLIFIEKLTKNRFYSNKVTRKTFYSIFIKKVVLTPKSHHWGLLDHLHCSERTTHTITQPPVDS